LATTKELRDAMMAVGSRLIEAQALELRLSSEAAVRPGLFREIRMARRAVDTLAEEYLNPVRRHRVAGFDPPDTVAEPQLHQERDSMQVALPTKIGID
jgi:hypothetical protein